MTVTAQTLAHLRLSFDLMAELTGSPVTPTKTNYYATYFTDQHVPLADINAAVPALLADWQHPYGPSPEKIAAKARDLATPPRLRESPAGNRAAEMESAIAQASDARWERQVEEANQWREANPEGFEEVLRKIDAEIAGLIATGRRPMLRDNKLYRDAYREGAVVGACLKEIGKLESLARKNSELSQNSPLTGTR